MQQYQDLRWNPSKIRHCTTWWSRDIPIRYTNWLRTGRPRSCSLSPGRVNNFLLSMSFRPALGYTQLPIQWIQGGSFPGGNAAGAWNWWLTSSKCRGQEKLDLYVHYSIRLHGVVLNLLKRRDNSTFLLHYMFRPTRPSSGVLEFWVTAVPSALPRSVFSYLLCFQMKSV
jgi:hypothetical protein